MQAGWREELVFPRGSSQQEQRTREPGWLPLRPALPFLRPRSLAEAAERSVRQTLAPQKPAQAMGALPGTLALAELPAKRMELPAKQEQGFPLQFLTGREKLRQSLWSSLAFRSS